MSTTWGSESEPLLLRCEDGSVVVGYLFYADDSTQDDPTPLPVYRWLEHYERSMFELKFTHWMLVSALAVLPGWPT